MTHEHLSAPIEPANESANEPGVAEREPLHRRLSRRWFLTAGLGTLGGCVSPINPLTGELEPDALVAGAALSNSDSTRVSAADSTRGPSAPAPEGIDDNILPTPVDPILRLVNRITYGFSRAEFQVAATLGYSAYLEQQLNPQSIDDSALNARLAAFDTLTMTSQQIFDAYRGTNQVPIQQMVQASILRQAFSKRQLLERLVEFWSDHLNIDIQDGQCRFLKTADDRDVIRVHALGKFPDLIRASARSAAMLFYLDNFTNVVGTAQENYAREFCELHNMGVDGGYTQQDVQEIARCFTGWTYRQPNSGQFGTFLFNPFNHDNGPKTVLGVPIPAGGGISDGDMVISIVTSHPSTANFIARKLTALFHGYAPDAALVARVAQTYRDTGGDMKAMLRVILAQKALTQLATPKLKRPIHHLASVLRATGATVNSAQSLATQLDRMGQRPMHWPAPNGYPDALGAWGTNVLPRWQMASDLFDGRLGGAVIDVIALLNSENGLAPGQTGAAINRILTGGALRDDDEAAIQAFFESAPGALVPRARDAFGLAASMQGYQWY